MNHSSSECWVAGKPLYIYIYMRSLYFGNKRQWMNSNMLYLYIHLKHKHWIFNNKPTICTICNFEDKQDDKIFVPGLPRGLRQGGEALPGRHRGGRRPEEDSWGDLGHIQVSFSQDWNSQKINIHNHSGKWWRALGASLDQRTLWQSTWKCSTDSQIGNNGNQ